MDVKGNELQTIKWIEPKEIKVFNEHTLAVLSKQEQEVAILNKKSGEFTTVPF